jgi:DUF4097 and DUF4098 domain-containing protein YvlB
MVLGAAVARAADDPDWVKSYTVSAQPTVHVHTNEGSVHVITSDTQQVEFRVKTEGSAWGIGFNDTPHIESRQDGNLVELTMEMKNIGIGVNTRHVLIEVRMPKNADLQLETSDGAIEIGTLNGKVKAHTSDGHVKLADINGPIDVTTSDGSVEARTLKGTVKLHTSDGSITATGIDGPLEASSSDGSVRVEGRFDSLDVHSGDGSVTTQIDAGSVISSAWQVSSNDGSIEVSLPADFKTDLDVSTGDGHITFDLPVQVQGELSKRHIHGAMNGGGPAFRIHSSDGSIHLSHI